MEVVTVPVVCPYCGKTADDKILCDNGRYRDSIVFCVNCKKKFVIMATVNIVSKKIEGEQ